jgi:large subunit ribosomal protein L9
VVKVADGYGRNFLIPNGMAFTVTEANKRLLAQDHKQWVVRELKRKEDLQQLADALAEFSLTIEANATDEGQLFGSVNLDMIRSTFASGGFEIESRQIELDDNEPMPIKRIGMYNIKLTLHPDIIVWCKCFVLAANIEATHEEQRRLLEHGPETPASEPAEAAS